MVVELELSLRPDATELQKEMEERKSACVEDENNSKLEETPGSYLAGSALPPALSLETEPQALPQALSSGILNPVFLVKESQELWAINQGFHNISASTSSATCFSMAVSRSTSCAPRTGTNIQEINKELRSQLAKCKQDFRDLSEKFLISQATSYSLANQLQKYKSREYKDILESVLGEKLQFEEEELAEQPGAAARLGKSISPIDHQPQELIQIQEKLQGGRELSQLLKQLFRDLLAQNEPDNSQWPCFQEKMLQGLKLAERLYQKLCSENHEDEEGEVEELPASRVLEKPEELSELQTDTLEEGSLTTFHGPDLSDSMDPPSNMAPTCDELQVCSSLDEPKHENTHKDEQEEESVAGRDLQKQEEMKDAQMDTLNEGSFTSLDCHDLSDFQEPPSSMDLMYQEREVHSPLDEAICPQQVAESKNTMTMACVRVLQTQCFQSSWLRAADWQRTFLATSAQVLNRSAPPPATSDCFLLSRVPVDIWGPQHYQDYPENYEDEENEEERESPDPRLIRELEKDTVKEVLQDSIDECYLSPSSHNDLTDSQHPPCSTSFLFPEHGFCCVPNISMQATDPKGGQSEETAVAMATLQPS
ncbi:neuroblastoma breakpoint family member 1-like [Choloepus didactylus]|uniref:neuroblastoma breakpoint family member 1-like n=1 Tax=Choloepus didactylus TaxID=27675 RepID=UPI00189FCDD3|nr:neuroblastoma breakpoint family member 1-like [Choloepus didactylus]